MDGKTIVGIALIVGIVSIAFLAVPIQAYVNGTGNSDLLQTQDRDRLRTQNRDCMRTQYHNRQRTNECAANGICNCTMRSEQYREQSRERTRNLGN